jgi:hypothetical protein
MANSEQGIANGEVPTRTSRFKKSLFAIRYSSVCAQRERRINPGRSVCGNRAGQERHCQH